MRCPVCSLDRNHVAKVYQGDDDVITRVRRCVCGYRFKTYETREADIRRYQRLEQTMRDLFKQLYEDDKEKGGSR